jgi:hypothetical protein
MVQQTKHYMEALQPVQKVVVVKQRVHWVNAITVQILPVLQNVPTENLNLKAQPARIPAVNLFLIIPKHKSFVIGHFL